MWLRNHWEILGRSFKSTKQGAWRENSSSTSLSKIACFFFVILRIRHIRHSPLEFQFNGKCFGRNKILFKHFIVFSTCTFCQYVLNLVPTRLLKPSGECQNTIKIFLKYFNLEYYFILIKILCIIVHFQSTYEVHHFRSCFLSVVSTSYIFESG